MRRIRNTDIEKKRITDIHNPGIIGIRLTNNSCTMLSTKDPLQHLDKLLNLNQANHSENFRFKIV